ncbi:MAG: hypothetical protein IKG30_13025 [Clostridiales bacterium]|nr:hypothetical protein [Clostridiales bacterium]
MAKVKMEIEAEPAQIEALNIFLGGKNTCLEFEISEHIESLYKKNVPKIVRDYIAASNENKKNERRSEAI